jgi:hypothetical protein
LLSLVEGCEWAENFVLRILSATQG